MKLLYKGTDTIEVKVPRNGGSHVDSITVRPSANPYDTPDQEFVAAALTMPDLFATPDDQPVSEAVEQKVDDVIAEAKTKKKE